MSCTKKMRMNQLKVNLNMTINDLYREGIAILNSSDIEDAAFDARCLLEFALNVDTTLFLLARSQPVSEDICKKYFGLISERKNGIPLQYILGKWAFMDNEFYVGNGVLIPRPETEKLVELAVEFLSKKDTPTVVDFCSGSGCIAVSIGKLLPDAKVYAIEKYDEAFSYLERNIALNEVENVFAIKGDIFDKNVIDGISPDLVVSNPPYIREEEISQLSVEVQNEPLTALDGGKDGYDFYRILADFWLKEYLSVNSAMFVECGEDQGDYIKGLFSEYCRKSEVIYDFNGLQRIVTAFK